MKISSQTYKICGMNKDLSYSSFNPEFSWDNKNIRLTARDGNDTLSITNEKGTLLYSITNEGNSSSIDGQSIGSCVLNDYLTIFTTSIISGVHTDRIYRIKNSNTVNSIIVDKLFEGTLGFNSNNLIQTLPFYENLNVQKVYWIDGLNQPRVINIVASNNIVSSYTNTSFNFSQNINLTDNIQVSKLLSGGTFKSGVIQYMFSYYSENGIESSIFYTSQLLYISPATRGGKPDEVINNSFQINFSGLDTNFKYIRVYSMYRTSLNTTPIVTKVVDLPVSSSTFSYTDNGSNGETLTSDILLYIGSSDIIPKCMSQKSNTLFMGNIVSNEPVNTIDRLSDSDISNFNWIEGSAIPIESVSNVGASTFYPYSPDSLNSDNNKIQHFKFDETYRLGIQGQYANGKFSTPIWITLSGGDVPIVNKRYRSSKSSDSNTINIYPIYGQLNLPIVTCQKLIDLGFKRIRPMIVPMSMNDRSIIAQGILTNTLSTLKDRKNISSTKYAMPDYLIRYNKEQINGECLRINTGGYVDYQIENMATGYSENETDSYFPGIIQTATVNDTIFDPAWNTIGYDKRNVWFKDTNFVNFWSPDLIYNKETIGNYIENATKIGLYGAQLNTGYDFNINVDGNWENNYTGTNKIDKLNPFNTQNYTYSSNIFTPNIHKSLFGTMYVGAFSRAEIPYPIWSPKEIAFDNSNNIDNIYFNFTKYNRYNTMYFSLANNLDDSRRFEIEINTPSFMLNSGSIFSKTNNSDNGGSVVYNRDVEENYISGTFASKLHKPEGNNTGWFATAKSETSMQVKYSSNIHAAFSLKDSTILGVTASPCIPTLGSIGTSYSESIDSSNVYWRSSTKYGHKVINSNDYGYINGNFKGCGFSGDVSNMVNSILVYDIYKDTSNKYGGTSEYAITNNQWIPAGNLITLPTTASGITVNYTQGDTHIQRYDMLRIYTDSNQIPNHNEQVSFLCESIINLDGRDDVNRYTKDIYLMSNSNFGLFNNAYSQSNNYFNYNILDLSRFGNVNYPNTIIWSKTKISGATTDAWTNMSMLSSIDLDGTYGSIASINLKNNNLYTFQDSAIAQLLFNERIQQQTSDGLSLELLNGYKVPDYRYLRTNQGTNNKFSIVEGENALYYIDYLNKSFNCIGENSFDDISSQIGFKSWFNNNTLDKKYILSYDKINNDIYINDNSVCLNYSETLKSFVSFFDYTNKLQMKTVWNNFVSIYYDSENNRTSIWANNLGNYNSFYGVDKSFYIEYLFNPDPLNDKVFNTIEYRLNNQLIDWNGLEITNWYQLGELNDKQYSDNLKRKFNVNRIQLPRQSKTIDNNGELSIDTRNSLNRIRSTWTKLKLSHNTTDTNINKKFDMQDLTVTYTV